MTNLEKLKLLDAEEFVKETVKLYQHPAKKYIDYTAYLNSEDENILHFVRHKGRCRMKEISADLHRTDLYEEPEYGIVVEERSYFSADYVIVLTNSGQIMSVPKERIEMI